MATSVMVLVVTPISFVVLLAVIPTLAPLLPSLATGHRLDEGASCVDYLVAIAIAAISGYMHWGLLGRLIGLW